MAKKAAKKEAPAAKAKKAVAKPAAKAAAKPAAKKAPAKVAKPVAKEVKAKAPAPVAAKPQKAAKPAKVEKPVAVAAPKAVAPAAVEKPAKAEKKSAAVVAEEPATKKGKKAKVDKSGLSEDQAKWTELHEKYQGMKAPAYSIGGQFEAKTPLQHKIFGWGYILSNEYDRLEVLFQDGKRMLISNRKLS